MFDGSEWESGCESGYLWIEGEGNRYQFKKKNSNW